MIKHSEEFKQEAVRIALSGGLPRARVAADLGVGQSTLGKWFADYRPADLVSMLGGINGAYRPFAGSCASANVAIVRGVDDRPARMRVPI